MLDEMTPAAQLIRRARTEAGLSQAQLAARLRTTQSAVARLEGRRSNPTLATLEDALDATGHRLELAAVKSEAAVDESQLRERLALTPAERLATFTASHRNLRALTAKARRVENAT